jgi:hypothetical protein
MTIRCIIIADAATTEPGLQVGPHLFFPVMTSRVQRVWRVARCAALLSVVSACGGTLPSGMGTPRPVPTPAPAAPPPSTPTPAEWRPTFSTTPATFRVRLEVGLLRDSAGRREEAPVTTTGRVMVRWPGGGAGRVEGRVLELTVTGSDRIIDPTLSATTRVVAFAGTVDSGAARLAVVPALVNECDAPEVTALSLAREVVLRWPSGAVVPGSTWRDSVATFSCRGGVPITTRVRTRVMVRATSDLDVLDVVRSSELELLGELKQPWRAVRLRGRGTGEHHVLVSRTSGQIVRVDGTTTTELVVTDPTRGGEQKVTQKVTVMAEREPSSD